MSYFEENSLLLNPTDADATNSSFNQSP